MASLPDSLVGDQSSPGGKEGQNMSESSQSPADADPQNMSRSCQPGDADPSGKVPVEVEQLILDLRERPTRENALQRLSKIREIREDLAPLIWLSFGTPYILLKEIIAVYPVISTSNFTQELSNRICNVLSLYQCVAAHPDTKRLFLNADMPMYICPFLNTVSKDKPHEYLRLSTLGVIGALVKDSDEDIVIFLLKTQAFCYCLRCIEVGTILSRTVATFVVDRILSTEEGLRYCSTFGDRFHVVVHVLVRMLDKLAEEPSLRLLKLAVHCFLRLSEGTRDNPILKFYIPKPLKDPKVINLLSDDPLAMSWMKRMVLNVKALHQLQAKAAPGGEHQNGHMNKS